MNNFDRDNAARMALKIRKIVDDAPMLEALEALMLVACMTLAKSDHATVGAQAFSERLTAQLPVFISARGIRISKKSN